MRSLGLPEVLIILGLLVLLFGGARLPAFLAGLGRRLGLWINQWRWVWRSMAGTEEEEIRAEEKVGREQAARFLEYMPPAADSELVRGLQSVGDRLARTAPAARRTFHFHVVEAPAANAFALPGGYVFVTRRLAEMCEDSAETAFLLAHEMAHVVSRHFVENTVLDTLLGALKTGRLVAELVGKGYSREQELEADRKALELVREAGFAEDGARRILRKLHGLSPEPPELLQYLSTHPRFEERLEALRS
jgi:predicted Zn-dependent protease